MTGKTVRAITLRKSVLFEPGLDNAIPPHTEFDCPVEFIDQLIDVESIILAEDAEPELPDEFPHRARLLKIGMGSVKKVRVALSDGTLQKNRFGKGPRIAIQKFIEEMEQDLLDEELEEVE